MPTTEEARPPNPSGDRRGPRPEARDRRPVIGGLWVLFALLLVMALVQGLFVSSGIRTVSYSEFKAMVRSGGVEEVVIGTDRIRGTVAGDPADLSGRITVIRVQDPSLVKKLEQYGVRITGERESLWGPALLIWVVPFLLLLVVMAAMFRQV